MNSMAASCDSTLDDSVAGDVDDSESTGNIHADDASAKLLASHRPGFRRKTPLETVLVMGIMAVASLVNTQDFLLRNRVLELLKKALWGVAEADFTTIYCGVSVAISFRSDSEVALQTAQLLRGLAAQRYGHTLGVRIGIHLGPVREVPDAQNRVNLLGDGINVAQRVPDFAKTKLGCGVARLLPANVAYRYHADSSSRPARHSYGQTHAFT